MSSSLIIVFGASGRTGMAIVDACRQAGYNILFPSHAELPLENTKALEQFILTHRPVAVINAAAISGLEDCLEDPLKAHLINALAPASMALACKHVGARFIHLSTDYVLDGRKKGLKSEQYKRRPSSIYAQSKWEGEQQVLEAYEETVIARVSWVCGNPKRPAFVEQICDRALRSEPLAAIADKFSKPTNVVDIARALLSLIDDSTHRGTVHLCSSGEALSWWDCAQFALQELQDCGAIKELPNIDKQVLGEIVFFREDRPRFTAMDNAKLTQDWGLVMPDARDTIRAAVRAWLAQRAADS